MLSFKGSKNSSTIELNRTKDKKGENKNGNLFETGVVG